MAAELDLNAESGGPISAINVTPFVDVVLVLLVIFMVTAPAIMKDILGVQLPKTESSDSKTSSIFSVAVTRQGQFLLNGQLTTLEGLKGHAKTAIESDKDVQAILAADRDARHGDVVQAIDVIKTAGITRFAIQVEQQDPSLQQ